MADEVVMGLLKRKPANIDDLAAMPGMPRPVARRYGERFVEAIQSDEMPKLSGPKTRLAEETVEQRVTIDSLWAAITAASLAGDISPALLSSRSHIAAWYLRQPAGAPLTPPELPGWRGQFMQDSLGDFLAGERTLDLSWHQGRLSRPDRATE